MPISTFLALTLSTSAATPQPRDVQAKNWGTNYSKSSEEDQNAVLLNLTVSQPESNDLFSLADAELGLDFIAEVEANGVESATTIPISWSSNREGFLGMGNELLQVPLIEPGTHTITAFAEDGPDNQASKSVEIGVLPFPPTEGETIEELAQKGSEEARASIAATAEGGSVIAWQGDFGAQVSNQESSVQVTLLDSQDQFVTTLRVSGSTSDTQTNPHLAVDEDGLFMVVWESTEGGNTRVKGSIFFLTNQVGNEFLLSEQQDSFLSRPQVVVDGKSGFIAVWQRRPSGSAIDRGDIFARRFDRVGNPTGNSFRVNSQILGEQRNPSLVSLPGRGFVVVWESSFSQERADIHLRRFDFLDQALDDDLRVNTDTSGLHTHPRAVATRAGDFVVVWKSTTLSSSFPTAQTFRIASRPGENLHFTDPDFLFEEFTITETTEAADEPFDPAVAMNRDGDFLVSWAEGPGSGNSSRIRYQTFFFLESESQATSDIRALDFFAEGHPATAFVGANLSNAFLVFWNSIEDTSDTSSKDLLGKRISLAYEPFLPSSFIFTDGFESGEPSGWTRAKGLQ